VLARHQLVRELGIPYAKALSFGLPIGWLYDAGVALAPSAVAGLLWAALRVPYLFTWLGSAGLIWATTFANVLYFRFFGSSLEAWVVRYHVADLVWIRDQIAPVAMTGPLLTSGGIVVGVGVLLLVLWHRRRPAGTGDRARRMRVAAASLLLLILSAGLAVAAGALETGRYRSVLTQEIVVELVLQCFDPSRHGATGPRESDQLRRQASGVDPDKAARAGAVLRAYRDWIPGTEPAPGPRPAVPPGVQRGWPLERELSADPELAGVLRAELGLRVDVRPNVIVLLLESVRALEVLDPEIGAAIFPRLRAVLAQHAVFFRSAYSGAAFDAGRTVNG
jgi:hypothetical protein